MTILREKKPAVADFIGQWQQKYQRAFRLTDAAEQANFYEAMVEIARHLAHSSTSVAVSLTVSNEGVDGLRLSVCPKV